MGGLDYVGIKGWDSSQAVCTAGHGPLLFILISRGVCHGASITGWEAGCRQSEERGQDPKTPSPTFGFSLCPLTLALPRPLLAYASPWLLVECVERVEWLNQRSLPRLLLVSSDSCGPVDREFQLRRMAWGQN